MDPLVISSIRRRLRRPQDALPTASIGVVPILWNNADLADLRHGTPAETILDEVARTGYEGTQWGVGFPSGDALRAALRARHLRLAEVYVSLPNSVEGPAADALAVGRERLRLLQAGDGDVLCVALERSAGRVEVAGRASNPDTPRLSDAGWQGLIDVVHELARAAVSAGNRAGFHPHVGTFVETPEELDRLVAGTDPSILGICIDVGHVIVGGGDPVATIRALGSRVIHVHLKDVDGEVLEQLRDGRLGGFDEAIRARLFTELGSGILDLDAVLASLIELDYQGWLMVEQDSTWAPPSESAAIGRHVLATALRRLGRARAA